MDETLFAKLESKKGYDETHDTKMLNPYVNFNKYKNSQSMVDSMVAESIQMKGDVFYFLPRKYKNKDIIFGEDPTNFFDKAYPVSLWIGNFDAYEGDGSIFSKFGFQANDEIRLALNPNLFKKQTGEDVLPVMGDLIYFPMDKSLFEVTWVEPYTPFYQLGKNVIKNITAQKFIYSNEDINVELNKSDDLNENEFDLELDLEPIRNLNGISDINVEQYSEDSAIADEAKKFVNKKYVYNGKGEPTPFDDFGGDE